VEIGSVVYVLFMIQSWTAVGERGGGLSHRLILKHGGGSRCG
jgi:hypothetical protein